MDKKLANMYIFPAAVGEEKKSVSSLVVEGDTVRINHVGGCAPCSSRLNFFVSEIVEMYGVDELLNMRRNRKYPFRVKCREGKSGSHDYYIEYYKAVDGTDYYIPMRSGRLHISVYWKLNQPIKIWVGDFIEIAYYNQKDCDEGVDMGEESLKKYLEYTLDNTSVDDDEYGIVRKPLLTKEDLEGAVVKGRPHRVIRREETVKEGVEN